MHVQFEHVNLPLFCPSTGKADVIDENTTLRKKKYLLIILQKQQEQ